MLIPRASVGPILLLAGAMFLSGCGADTIKTTRPLIDNKHGAEVLTERNVLSNPRSVRQNRLLRGWRFLPQPGGPQLVPCGDESVIEFTNLSRRTRTLALDVIEHSPGASLTARAAGSNLGTFPLSGRVVIPLPNELPVGRAVVSLTFSDPEQTRIARVAVMPTLHAGNVEIGDDLIIQTGWSAVEVTQRVEPGARFAVDFVPPDVPVANQRFVVSVVRDSDSQREVFSWTTSRDAARPGPRSVEIDLGEASGIVRILLEAKGRGPAGRWKNPRIIKDWASAEAPPPPDLGEPPRLVILYVMDALRADHVGPERGLTPVLDELASEGVRFVNHFAVAPNTPPSTRALFSGLTLLDERQLPHPGPERIAEIFQGAGYRTACITGNPHLSPELDLGVGFESLGLFRVTEDHRPDAPPTPNISAEVLHEAALEWIHGLAPGERGFLYIHTMNPHNPYTPPPEIEARIAPPGPSDIDGRTRTLVAVRDQERAVEDDDRHRLRQLYAAGVAYNDRELGNLVTGIGNNLDPQEVIFIATSDHGEELFEHGGVLHGHSLYDELLRIPLTIHWPEKVAPGRIASPTTTLDLHASLVALAGGSVDASTGSSLWPLVLNPEISPPPHELVFAAAPGIDGATMVRSQHRKLIFAPRNGKNRGQGNDLGRSWDLEYVFDLEADPGETTNLAGWNDLEMAWLRTRLAGWTAAQQALQPEPGSMTMSDETRDQLEALGYLVDQ